MGDIPGVGEGVLWAIILCPLAAFAAIALYLRERPRLAGYLSIAAIAASFALALFTLTDVLGAHGHAATHTHDWFRAGPLQLSLGVRADGLSAVMLVVVTSVALLVQVYSQGYMERDPGYGRYYAWMSLFAAAMLGLVLADNLFMLFVFWELVGLASYLLIGFWFHKPSAAAAAKKAFIVTRHRRPGAAGGHAPHLDARGHVRHRRNSRAGAHGRAVGHDADAVRAGAVRGGGGQERAVPPARVAAGRHGGPHARLRAHPRRHHGGRRGST